jgi:hypothetical protein
MNNEDGFAELIRRPTTLLTVRSDIHTLRLASATDLWYSGGGAFQPLTFGFTGRPSGGARSLATLYDPSIDYRLGAHASLGLYYGYADGKSVIQHIYPQGANGQQAYLDLTYRFCPFDATLQGLSVASIRGHSWTIHSPDFSRID